ncbi:MAG: hypothetical protein ACE5KT_00790 [Methanosarcinales archaeon]
MKILTRKEFDKKYSDNVNFTKYSNSNDSCVYLESKDSLIRVSALPRYGFWKGIELGKDSLTKFRKIIKKCNGNLVCIDEIDKQIGIYEMVKEIEEELVDKALLRMGIIKMS